MQLGIIAGPGFPFLEHRIREMLASLCGPVEFIQPSVPGTGGDLVAVIDLRAQVGLGTPASRFGTWRFSWDGTFDVALAGMSALHEGRRHSTVELLDGSEVLDRASIKTVPHSLDKTRERLLAAASTMPARRLLLQLNGVNPPSLPASPPRPVPPVRLSPAVKLRNMAGRVLRETWEEQWRVGILEQSASELVSRPEASRIQWLPPRRHGYHADPFGQPGDDGLILAEAYDYSERLGYLVAIDRDGRERTVLREPFHLSFPQIIEHQGQRWLLPEAKAAGLVRLYRPDPWPERFVPGPVLIEELAAADPTLYRDEQGFWLFAGDGAGQDETTLVLYHAPDLLGPWRPHPMNPIKVDLGSARPAGPLFQTGGRLWRPAQDCRDTYGGAIVLNEVLTLSPDLYAERPGPLLRPDPAGPCPHGLHTLTPFGDGFLVDGKREFRSMRRLAAGLRSLARG